MLTIYSPAEPRRYSWVIIVPGDTAALVDALAKLYPHDRWHVEQAPIAGPFRITSTNAPDETIRKTTADIAQALDTIARDAIEKTERAALAALTAAQPQSTQKEADTMSALKNLVMSLDRPHLLAVLSDETVSLDTLRVGVFVMLGGNAAELGTPAPALTLVPPLPGQITGALPAAPAAPKVPKPRKTAAAPAAAAPTNGAAATPADPVLAQALAAFVQSGQGFAAGQFQAATGKSTAQCRTVLQNAVKQGLLHMAGDRRFARYGATAAIAQAASTAARG